MNYYFEFEGGLGDIIFRVFAEGEYRFIDRIAPADRARISLITINPFADELFEWHPKRNQLDISMYAHWPPSEDEAMRMRFHLPAKTSITRVDSRHGAVNFYACTSDKRILGEVSQYPYFVIAASAGDAWRIIPDGLVTMICNEAAKRELRLLAVGRSYPVQKGGDRYEPRIPLGQYTMELIDALSVPGTAKLVEGATGVICTHTSICHLAWFLNKPVLLLYPLQVYEEHISAPPTGYTRGLNSPTTLHSLFEDCNPSLIQSFFDVSLEHSKYGASKSRSAT
jgi:hypothetical protein